MQGKRVQLIKLYYYRLQPFMAVAMLSKKKQGRHERSPWSTVR